MNRNNHYCNFSLSPRAFFPECTRQIARPRSWLSCNFVISSVSVTTSTHASCFFDPTHDRRLFRWPSPGWRRAENKGRGVRRLHIRQFDDRAQPRSIWMDFRGNCRKLNREVSYECLLIKTQSYVSKLKATFLMN